MVVKRKHLGAERVITAVNVLQRKRNCLFPGNTHTVKDPFCSETTITNKPTNTSPHTLVLVPCTLTTGIKSEVMATKLLCPLCCSRDGVWYIQCMDLAPTLSGSKTGKKTASRHRWPQDRKKRHTLRACVPQTTWHHAQGVCYRRRTGK